MPHVNEPVFRIRTAHQLRVLADPGRPAIFEAMCELAPCGAAELAGRLGRSPESLHYHLRKLLDIGLIRIVDRRPTGGRKRTVYDLVARMLKLETVGGDRAFRKAKADGATTFLRLTDRQMREAILAEINPPSDPDARIVRIERELVSISARDLRRLNRLLDEIHHLCSKADRPTEEHRIALTFAMCPEP